MKLKYFLDTEFIEDGKTIDLISIGIVCEGGRKLYHQNCECNFAAANDWVWRNVFPHLQHFDMRGKRSCTERHETYDSGLGHRYFKKCGDDCPWADKIDLKNSVLGFCDVEKYGKPEFWGYFCDYDWVAFCQLFGPMIALPKGFPMYCRDIKQFCDSIGNPQLPAIGKNEHSALKDAEWNFEAWKFLNDRTVTCVSQV